MIITWCYASSHTGLKFAYIMILKLIRWIFNSTKDLLFILHVIFFFFFFFRAAPLAYGSSQARGWIGTAATGLCHSHSNAGSKLHCDLHCSSQQLQILKPLSGARDGAWNLMDTSQIHYCWATMGTPILYVLITFWFY